MSTAKRTVLITGCSDTGLGAALARAFHNAGLKVYATARNPSKMRGLEAMGIETLTLDVLDDASIARAASQITELDILVNNAGAAYIMPVFDTPVAKSKELFELNVWSYLAVTRAFLPLIIKSKGMIVNHSSLASVLATPWNSHYSASKAAIASFSESQRLELSPFGVRVVDLKTGAVRSNINNLPKPRLPDDSIFVSAREAVDKSMTFEEVDKQATDSDNWAKAAVADLLKSKPPGIIWKGPKAWLVWLGTILPHGSLDGKIKSMLGFDAITKELNG
ncbi:NAD(P)-binding protein [Venturia nashicola]|nr:NAD(P)-binding protein [Venturia nashicola]